jgi:uncharacterized protein YgiM (DUF1202 family)
MMHTIYTGEPVTVTIEASADMIAELELDTAAGDHYDHIGSVISIEQDSKGEVTITSTRSVEAWRKGEPNAGRGVWVFDRSMLERIYLKGKIVWGKASAMC